MLVYLVYVFLPAGVVLSITSRKLTVWGGITGGMVGLLVYNGTGYTGLGMLVLFFIAGSVATGWQASHKQESSIAEMDKGRRTAGQVIANGGIAAILGACAWLMPQYASLCRLMIAGSLASATADTLASELGSVYGRKFYDVLSLEKAQPGPDGVVSLEGTLIGIAGAGLIGLLYAAGAGFSYAILIIIAAGAIGNLTDSLLGATLERKRLLSNNAVNFLNTATGAGVCLLLHWLIS